MAFTVLALGGDGIGPEVLEASLKVLDTVARSARIPIDLEEDLLHGAAWDAYGVLIRPETLERARRADALLVGAVGGPKWDDIVIEGGPEDQDGLMKLRRELDTFACIRHARAWDALIDRTPYLPGRVHGADIIVMRELCAGAMFTRTRGMDTTKSGERRAYDLNEYTDEQIRRFARIGFEIARRRTGRVVSVDKSNVFIAGKLWREAVDDVGRSEFPDIELTHLFADNAAYQLACRPADFDVVLADNLFGDLLSDQAGAISGSLGMLPSACLSDLPRTGRVQGPAIYEPVHGSAPDIAGQGIANPVGMILSVAMMLDYSMGAVKTARRLEAAVDRALASGYATRDLGGTHSTAEMTDAVIREFRSL